MNRIKILTSVLLVAIYIYLGELYKLWDYDDKIKLHHVAEPMFTQWYVTMLSVFIRPLILIFIIWWNRLDAKFILWVCSILGIFCLQDFVWLLWNFQYDKSYYWTTFYVVAIVDTFFFRKYWLTVLKNSP